MKSDEISIYFRNISCIDRCFKHYYKFLCYKTHLKKLINSCQFILLTIHDSFYIKLNFTLKLSQKIEF